ncbi:MAG: hypothetical protein JSR82_03305 [Verrucomicrobia bacterium]|nr:hypothetical protein [Verrucomicrobiota bacterium]
MSASKAHLQGVYRLCEISSEPSFVSKLQVFARRSAEISAELLHTLPPPSAMPLRRPSPSRAAGSQSGGLILSFSEAEVKCGMFGRLPLLLAPDSRSAADLRALQGILCVRLPEEGARPWEPSLSDAHRSFCRGLFQTFPYWGYFFSLGVSSLWSMSIALVDDVSLVRTGDRTGVRFMGTELLMVVEEHVRHAREMTRRAGGDAADELRLEQALRAYFHRAANGLAMK